MKFLLEISSEKCYAEDRFDVWSRFPLFHHARKSILHSQNRYRRLRISLNQFLKLVIWRLRIFAVWFSVFFWKYKKLKWFRDLKPGHYQSKTLRFTTTYHRFGVDQYHKFWDFRDPKIRSRQIVLRVRMLEKTATFCPRSGPLLNRKVCCQKLK